MNSENIKKVTNQAIEQLIQALERGHSEMLTQYLAAIGRFHRYSLRNVMLIASQKPAATHVAGFHTWHKLGRFVKKGEKGILILAPIVRRKNESAEQNETDGSSTAVGFRAAYVFDISQTDGQELPEIGSVIGDPSEYRERLGKFVAEQGIALEYSQDIAPARGTSAGGKITLLPGQSPAEEFATLAHELAHEMMHRDERRSSTSKRSRETEAEAVAFVVCQAIGLETGSAARDYIQLYEGDAKLLTDRLERIQVTSTQVLEAIRAEIPEGPYS
jgi:antirestriction protein ArdC